MNKEHQPSAPDSAAPSSLSAEPVADKQIQELRSLVAELAENDTYETEYDGRMYTICHGCGAQDGEPHRSANCVYLRANAALAHPQPGTGSGS
jgi:hypothetical protein